MLNKVITFFKKYGKQLKTIYIFIIALIVLKAIYSICVQTPWNRVEHALGNMRYASIAILLIIGSLAVIPMVVYDYVYSHKVGLHIHKLPLLRNSYIINSFTNIGGSGGFVGASLRMYLFGTVHSKIKETLKVVTQIALFTSVGLIINDIVALILNISYFSSLNGWIKLTCSLFPLYILVPFIIRSKSLNAKNYVTLFIGSTLEWLSALGFFILVAYTMDNNINIAHVYLAVVFAGIIGAISLIPGGTGSFDTALILGMNQFGIPTASAMTWDLIYRICYYIIPFIIGLVFLIFVVIKRKISQSN